MTDLFYVVLKADFDIWFSGSYLDCKSWIKYNIKYIYHDNFDIIWYSEYERRLDMFNNI